MHAYIAADLQGLSDLSQRFRILYRTLRRYINAVLSHKQKHDTNMHRRDIQIPASFYIQNAVFLII